jgi:hypothetical protein
MSRVSRKARFANRARGSIITSQEGRPRRKAKGDETGRPYRRQGLQPARLRGKRATKRRWAQMRWFGLLLVGAGSLMAAAISLIMPRWLQKLDEAIMDGHGRIERERHLYIVK